MRPPMASWRAAFCAIGDAGAGPKPGESFNPNMMRGMITRLGATDLFAIAERADHVAPLSRHLAKMA
ncbi:MAG: hypothetical protein ACTS5I_04135, partial [Rhodanobacter sp.]